MNMGLAGQAPPLAGNPVVLFEDRRIDRRTGRVGGAVAVSRWGGIRQLDHSRIIALSSFKNNRTIGG